MNGNYEHLYLSNEKLGTILALLRHDFKPQSHEKISVEDLVYYCPSGTLGQVCQVERIDSPNESQCSEPKVPTKFVLKQLKKYTVADLNLYVDDTDVVPIRMMQQRLLNELSKEDCNEALVEFEVMDILFAYQSLEHPTSNLSSKRSESRKRDRSRSRDRLEQVARDSQQAKHRPEAKSHQISLAQTKNPLKFSEYLVRQVNTRSPTFDSDVLVLCPAWQSLVETTFIKQFENIGYPKCTDGQLLYLLAKHQTAAGYCETLHHQHEGSNYALPSLVIDAFMRIVAKGVQSDFSVRFVQRDLIDRLCTVVQLSIVKGYGASRLNRDLEKFRQVYSSPKSICFSICRDNHHYVILMSFDEEKKLVEVTVIDSLWQGLTDKIWHGPVTTTSSDSVLDAQNTEKRINGSLFKSQSTNGFCQGLDATLRTSLAYLSHVLWNTPLKGQKVRYRFPLVPYQGANNDCGIHAIYHMTCLLLRPAEYLQVIDSGDKMILDNEFTQKSRDFVRNTFALVLDSFSTTDVSQVFKTLRSMQSHFVVQSEPSQSQTARAQQNLAQKHSDNVQHARNLLHETEFPNLLKYEQAFKRDAKDELFVGPSRFDA